MAAQTKKTTTGAAATEEKTEVKVYHLSLIHI